MIDMENMGFQKRYDEENRVVSYSKASLVEHSCISFFIDQKIVALDKFSTIYNNHIPFVLDTGLLNAINNKARELFGGNQMIEIDMELQRKVIEFNGERQEIIFMEEPAELIQSVSKMRRGQPVKDNLVEEMADVCIVLAQMMEYYNIDKAYLQAWISKKEARMRNGYLLKEG